VGALNVFKEGDETRPRVLEVDDRERGLATGEQCVDEPGLLAGSYPQDGPPPDVHAGELDGEACLAGPGRPGHH
jgi:hypothetical protein